MFFLDFGLVIAAFRVSPRHSAPSPVKSKIRRARSCPARPSRRPTPAPTRRAKARATKRAPTVSSAAARPLFGQGRASGLPDGERKVELHVEADASASTSRWRSARCRRPHEVTGVAPLITTENATVGTVIENRRIVELPLNGRNFLSLVALSPNVSAEFAGAGQAGDRQGGSRANQQLSISGQRREFNYYTLDGTDNTDVNFNTYILLPSVDALEEFKVQTGIYSAEFGRAASQVNVVTKSGTNQFHGTVFEFLRNDAMDSRPFSFSAAQAALPKAPFKWNQYGYTLGGPIWSNKVFFMSNWEGYRDRKQNQQNYNLPLAAWRTGDFSSYSGAAVRSGHLHRRECVCSEDVRDVPRQPDSPSRIHPDFAEAARVLSRAERHGHRRHGYREQLHRDPESRDRQRPVHAAHRFRPELGIDLDGPVQPQPRRRNQPRAEAERHEAGQPDSSGDGRQYADALADCRQRIPVRLQLVLQHVRARAGLRARRHIGTGHPWHVDASGNRLGHSEHRHQRVERLWRQHRGAVHQPEQSVRDHRQRVVDQGPPLVQGRRRTSGSTTTTRSATSSRAAGSSSTAGRPGRWTATVPTIADHAPRHRLPTSCSATSVSPSCRSSWR